MSPESSASRAASFVGSPPINLNHLFSPIKRSSNDVYRVYPHYMYDVLDLDL